METNGRNHDMAPSTSGRPTLVLGGTGKTGRRVADRLEARGLPVRIGSRSAEPPFDWDDRGTWPALLDGVGAVYIAYYPDLATAAAVDRVGSFARLAVDHGVRRLVLLSGRGEREAEAAERAVLDTAAEVTIVRATWFSQNFSEGYWADYVRAGVVALPGGTTPEPFVDAADIADVAVAALTDDAHVGRLYTLTGPRLLTFGDAVAEIAAATGREVAYAPVTVEEHAAEAAALGEPPEVVELLTYLFATVLDGRNAHVEDGVQQALGRPARDFRDYARAAAASGAWDPVAVER
jgi:uncharacterized protein YbjT (DUF2867 family)